MPNEVKPSTIAALINSLTGAMCERMAKLFQFTSILHQDVSYYVNEAGLPADEFKADLCSALSGCIGTGGGGGTINPNMGAPTGVTATDGAFSDKVRVSWNAVTAPVGIAAVTQYKLYRSLATNTNPSNAALIQTVAAPTVIFDDTTVVPAVVYRYWLIASNGVDSSAFSNGDNGNASVPTGVLDDIVDLRATTGFGYAFIALVWTPPAGASKYDIYRNTVNTFSSATKILTAVSPDDTSLLSSSDPDNPFWDNDEELVLYNTPPSATTDYFFWVVAKGDSPPSLSGESNSALGRVNAPAIYNTTTVPLGKTEADMSYTVQAGETKMWAVLIGSGGGGAGGNATYGGGGGGGGGVVVEQFSVAEGDVVELVLTPDQTDTGNAASATDGGDGALAELKLNGSVLFSSTGGGGGQWSASGGGGGGGLGGAASGGAPEALYDGFDGKPGLGSAGGKSGYAFSQRRLPRAVPNDPPTFYNGDGDVAHAGSGGSSFPPNGLLAVGGKGGSGHAYLVFGT